MFFYWYLHGSCVGGANAADAQDALVMASKYFDGVTVDPAFIG